MIARRWRRFTARAKIHYTNEDVWGIYFRLELRRRQARRCPMRMRWRRRAASTPDIGSTLGDTEGEKVMNAESVVLEEVLRRAMDDALELMKKSQRSELVPPNRSARPARRHGLAAASIPAEPRHRCLAGARARPASSLYLESAGHHFVVGQPVLVEHGIQIGNRQPLAVCQTHIRVTPGFSDFVCNR